MGLLDAFTQMDKECAFESAAESLRPEPVSAWDYPADDQKAWLDRYVHFTERPYFNPNIDDAVEYDKRVKEEKRLIEIFNEKFRSGISVLEGTWDPEAFYDAARGLEAEPEGGERCTACFRLRLSETARIAAERGYDYFTTTLTISPLKDADRLNAIGEETGREYGVDWLPSDFKKRGGYQRSIELSREYDLYRQNYCGCSFSKTDR